MRDFLKYALLRRYCRLKRKFLKSCFTLSFILKRDFPKVAFLKLCGMTSSRNIDRI